MVTPDERILYLLRRFSEHTASDSQRNELRDWLAMHDDDGSFRTHLHELMANYAVEKKTEGVNWDNIFAEILSKREDLEVPVRRVPFIRTVWFRYAAVAASVLLFIFGVYFYRQLSTVNQLPTANYQLTTDITPGSNKAILTLSNGSKIILDSAHAGLLAQQNGASVIKSDSGALAYTATPSTVNRQPLTSSYNTLSTPRGGQYKLLLPDGSKVWLDAASSITYPTAFVGNERTVAVTGQAYFEVVHNAKRPFKVKVGNQTIEDVGTHFNINAYSDEPAITTTLIEGSVKIILPSTVNHAPPTVLTAGDQATVSPTNKIKLVRDADLDQVMAWRNGEFQFGDGKDIQSIMRQISRWYDVEVEYKGDVGGLIGGSISRNVNMAKVLKMLEKTGEVKFTVEGKKVIVMQ